MIMTEEEKGLIVHSERGKEGEEEGDKNNQVKVARGTRSGTVELVWRVLAD